jgi:superfamily I DNA/RNA helicase
MPIPQNHIDEAQAVQHQAAHDQSPQVRLIAGPGAGKSAAIEARVFWLLEQGVPAAEIFAVSFTRASARDLRDRIHRYCADNGQADASGVQVSTLHSLALRVLRKAGLLASRYPADPLVLDDWELENIFDAEYGELPNAGGKRRREEIRSYHEAYWSTGIYSPANYIPPDPPITDAESSQFLAFHGPRTQAYSCVLPGEIVRLCVEEMAAGNLDLRALLNVNHLIVDEFQDLNPMDLEFVNALVNTGTKILVAGDDDQSVYSFRFA